MTAKKPPLTVVGSTSTGVQPPRKLGKHGMMLWAGIQGEYVIDDRGGIELLAQACAAADRAEALAACVARDGETIKTRTGIRIHPAVREELANRSFVCRTLERLGVNVEAIKKPGRPGGFSSWNEESA
jgi:hypothetical protein